MPQLIIQFDSNDSNNTLIKIITSFATHLSSSTNVDFQHANHNCNVGYNNF